MSKWVSNLFTNLLVDPASLRRPPPEQPAAEAIEVDDASDDDDTSETSSVEHAASGPESASDVENEDENDEGLLAFLRDRMPSERVLIRFLELATRQIRRNANIHGDDFLLLWVDVLSNLPANGSRSTAQEVWVAREEILSALLDRRQREHGSGGTPETAVYTTRPGVVVPRLALSPDPVLAEGSGAISHPATPDHVIKREDSSESKPLQQQPSEFVPRHFVDATDPESDEDRDPSPPRRHNAFILPLPTTSPESSQLGKDSIEKNEGEANLPVTTESDQEEDHLPPPQSFLDLLRPSAEYKPRKDYYDAYEEDTLPTRPDPKLNRLRAQLEQPRGEDEEFSLQMILPATATNYTTGPSHLPLGAVFVPADEDIACGVLETPAPEPSPKSNSDAGPPQPQPQNIVATQVPREEMTTSLTALGERFSARACPPLHAPLEIDPNVRIVADYGSTAHKNSRTHMLETVAQAIVDVESPYPLSPGTQFELKTVVTQDVLPNEGAVIFVPDDPKIAPRGTDVAGLIHDSRTTTLPVREFPRRVVGPFGDMEALGRHKRKRVEEDGAEEGSALKRICGMEGRDTITRHTLLDMQVDDIWVGSHSRLSRRVKKEKRD
ncbi:hypothetical protein MVEN_02289700 [Mycena venus]|uniref:Uncharacterized protein n=1 Tax=Mycena venus TaxID=2733690 RepID=A0A8H6X5M9_9AGAR|nr:hypothetical protein MVEN_02289700 [Mycena venus]